MATSGAGTRPLFAVPRILAGDAGPAGTLVLRSADPLGEYPATVVDSLRAGARADPDHLLVAERDPGGAWRGCGYGAAVAAADEIGQALLDRGLGPDRPPLLLLSGNGVGHLLLTQAWPFLTDERPVIVDWLPWSGTFAGNHNVNMMLTCGGTLYVDAGRPAPGMFAPSIANLTEVPPTVYFNVAAGYAQLVPALEADAESAGRFYSRLLSAVPVRSAVPVLSELDADEITDKGYVNQRQVLACRAALAEMLYADPVPDGVVVAGTAA